MSFQRLGMSTVSRMNSVVGDWMAKIPLDEILEIRFEEKNGSVHNVQDALLAAGFTGEEVEKKNVWTKTSQVKLYYFVTDLANKLLGDAKAKVEEVATIAKTPSGTPAVAVDVTLTGTSSMVEAVEAEVEAEQAAVEAAVDVAEPEQAMAEAAMVEVAEPEPEQAMVEVAEPEPAVEVAEVAEQAMVEAEPEAAVEVDDGSEETETDEEDVIIPSRLTIDFKRGISGSTDEYRTFGDSVLTSVVGREAWMASYDIVGTQLKLADMVQRLNDEMAAWSSQFDSSSLRSDVEAAESSLFEAEDEVTIHSGIVSSLKDLIGKCKDPTKLSEYEARLASSEADLRSAEALVSSRREAVTSVRSSLDQTIKDINSVRRFVDPSYDAKGKWRAATAAHGPAEAAKKRSSGSNSGSGSGSGSNNNPWLLLRPSGERPETPVLIRPDAIDLMKKTFAELEAEHGDVFGTVKHTTTPCDCQSCLDGKTKHPASPVVKHLWAAFNVDGTLDVVNTGMWAATTKRVGESLGPHCLGRGVAKASGRGTYTSLISNVVDRVFGPTRTSKTFFFVHHHHDPLSPDNKYLILVPQCCESSPTFFAEHFPGYSSASKVFFASNTRTTNGKKFAETLYGSLGWNSVAAKEHNLTGVTTTMYYPGKGRGAKAKASETEKKRGAEAEPVAVAKKAKK